MNKESCNCIICANEFNIEDLTNFALLNINNTRFKVCQACLDSNPEDDYRQVRDIIDDYIRFSEAKSYFKEAKEIINSNKFKK